MTQGQTTHGKLSGRHVLLMLLGFFGIVLGVNIVMMRAAITTFGGTQTASSYQAGLNFAKDQAEAHAQAERQWDVGIDVTGTAGARVFAFALKDAQGRWIEGGTVKARLVHPADVRRDLVLEPVAVAPGRYRAMAAVPDGQWQLATDLDLPDGPGYHSINRLILR